MLGVAIAWPEGPEGDGEPTTPPLGGAKEPVSMAVAYMLPVCDPYGASFSVVSYPGGNSFSDCVAEGSGYKSVWELPLPLWEKLLPLVDVSAEPVTGPPGHCTVIDEGEEVGRVEYPAGYPPATGVEPVPYSEPLILAVNVEEPPGATGVECPLAEESEPVG